MGGDPTNTEVHVGRRHGRRTCLFVLTGLVSLALAAPASADDQTQPYVLTTSPSLTSAGQSVTVTATLSLPSPVGDRERDGDDQDDQLGSANLFLPTSVFLARKLGRDPGRIAQFEDQLVRPEAVR